MPLMEGIVTNLLVQSAAGIRPPDTIEAVIGGAVTSALPGGGALGVSSLIFNDLILKSRKGRSAFFPGGPATPAPGPAPPIAILPPPEPAKPPDPVKNVAEQVDKLRKEIQALRAALEQREKDLGNALQEIKDRVAKLEGGGKK